MGLGTTTWGTAVLSGQNGLRLGYRFDRSLSSASATVRLRIWAWTRRSAFDSSNSFSVSGNWPSRSTSVSISHSSSTSWSTSNRTLIYDETITVARQYGSSVSRSFNASLSGMSIVGGATASVSGSVSVPERGINPPAQQSGAFVYPQQNYTRALLEWTNHSTTAAPYQSIHLERRHIQDNGSFSSWTRRANLGRTVTSYTDTVTGNYHYHYRVRANNTAGNGPWLDMGRLNTTPPTPSVSASPVSAGIRVSWSGGVRIPSSQVRQEVWHRADGGSWSRVANLTANGHQTVWVHSDPDMTVTHQYRVRRFVTEWGSAESGWGTSNVVQLAAPPSAPTNLGPSGVWDASEDRTLSWRHVPTDGSEQERFQVRHRPQGGSWTTVPAVASGQQRWTLPGGTYAPGDVIEWQVRTWGVHPDPGPYSASNFQSPTSRPTVAINEPVDGSEIDTSSVLVTWGYSGPEQDDGDEGEITGQAAWRLTVLRGSNVVTEESGSDDRDEFLVHGLSDDATYTIRVEVRSGEGLWSAEPDEVTISVSYLPPAPPQIGVAFDRDLGAAVVDVQVAPPHEPYEIRNLALNPRGRALR